MYISTEAISKLDDIVKSFEVAYRSKIANSLIVRYPTLNDFSIAINKISIALSSSSTIFSRKYKAKSDKISSEIASHYKKIEDCNTSYLTKHYDNDVPYVSDIIDYVNLFFNECFLSLSNNFATVEEFNSLSEKYHTIRNNLSHPASARIKIQDAKDVIGFIKNQLNNIEKDKFWYISDTIILEKCNELSSYLEDGVIRVHNLDEVSFSNGKIVCRDLELQMLKEWLLGKDRNYRRSGSVVIYGYGGVGKTALILEFIYQIVKEIGDKKIISPYEFILFFTSKEESLQLRQTTGEAYISDIKKQISSFQDFKGKLEEELQKGQIDLQANKKGLIIIDNFETLADSDKIKFFEFIKRTPRATQYVITSRNEEMCEDKLPLKEFKEVKAGVKFIDLYMKANEIRLKFFLSEQNKRELVQLSKGNTLIIVLTIQQLALENSLSKILGDLRSVESSNMEIIADFMYKNTIQKSIDELKEQNKHPIEVLKIVSLYDEPIDLYSIATLSSLNISEVEYICNTFSSRLVLNKIGESFEPNEFANKFILLRYLPNNIERKDLNLKIKEYKIRLREKLRKLEITRQRESGLNKLMSDWKPRHIIDKIAIAESYTLYANHKDIDRTPHLRNRKIIKTLDAFEEIEKKSSHPYIKFQKARFLVQVYSSETNAQLKQEYREKISKSYDDAIMSTTFYYPYIINTKSFASTNWKYGLFWSNLDESASAAKYLEDSVEIFERIKIFDRTYFSVKSDLSFEYFKLYKKTNELKYKQAFKDIYHYIKNNYSFAKRAGFFIDDYLNRCYRLLRDGR